MPAFRLYVRETRSWWGGVVTLLQMHVSSEASSLEGRGRGAPRVSGRSSCFPGEAVLLPRGSGTPGEEARSSGGAQEAATMRFLSCVFSSCSSGSVWSLCPVFIGLTGLKMSVHCPPLMKFSAKCQRTCPNFDSVLSLASRVMFTGLHAGRT